MGKGSDCKSDEYNGGQSMNEKKFCFIICTNSMMYLEECVGYIDKLIVPQGFEVQILEIKEAVSMTGGYNEGMKATDAKYKIYMHQDVFILYPYFLFAILDIFGNDHSIGMIGMVGAEKMSADGVMWHSCEVGNEYYEQKDKEQEESPYVSYRYNLRDGFWTTEVIDGLMMITSVDVTWREDLFDGWDFYDTSQSFEMRKRGYKVVVPVQKQPWVLHDDGVLNLKKYDKYRQYFLKEYAEMLR